MSDQQQRTPAHDPPSEATARLDVANLPGGLPGKFRIVRVLGRGGNGIVVEAEDRLLGRRVAVKLLPEKAALRPESLQRFLREARAAASLVHPNVVTLFEIEEHNNAFYLVMELALHGSLQQHLDEKGPLPWREATRVVADACRGLIAAHAAGLIHRDIKPANLLLFPDGVTKLADFGLAKVLAPDALSITDVGVVLGTPHYMSPEQWRGDRLDARADIYALGATYYTLLTGETPFHVSDPLQMMFAHCSGDIPDPQTSLPSLPAGCAAIVRRAMGKSPADRYPSAEALMIDLDRLLVSPDGHLARKEVAPIQPRSFWRRLLPVYGMVLASVVLLVLLSFAIFRPKDQPDRGTDHLHWPENPLVTPGPIGAVAITTNPGPALLAWAFEENANDSFVTLWDLRAGAVRHQLPMRGSPKSLAFSPDGAVLAATGSNGGKVWRWDVVSGKEAPALEAPSSGGQALAFAPNGRLLSLVVTPWDQKDGNGVHVWDLSSRKLVSLTSPYKGACDAVVFSPDGSTLIVAARDGTLPRWNTSTWQPLPSLRINSGYLTCLAFSPDGKYLVGGVAPGRGERPLYVWDGQSGEPRPSLPGHTGDVFAIAVAPDSVTVASAGTDAIRLWNLETGQLLERVLRTSESSIVRTVTFSSEGPMLIRGGFDKRLLRWNLDEQNGESP